MISPQTGVGAYPASLTRTPDQDLLVQFRSVDAEVRRNLQKAMNGAGANATVTANFTYAIGPDGQLYAVNGTVSTSKKIKGPKTLLPGGPEGQAEKPALAVNPDEQNQRRPLSRENLQDFLSRDLGLGSSAFAALFSEEGEAVDGAALDELQALDIGVRNHERQHFNAAGGLVQGVPEFDFVKGPDGQYYAVGGHVDIGATATTDPDKARRDTITFANAATAPGDASSQDLSVAKSSYSKAAKAYNEVAYQVRYGGNNLVDMLG